MSSPNSTRRGPALSVEALEDRTTPSSTAYVNSLYTNLLHRTAQPAETAFWMAQLDSGTPAATVTAEFVHSSEYQRNFVLSCYQLFLNRQPSPGEVSGWVGAIANGLSDQQCEAEFLTSAEFFGAHPGGSSTWINAVFEQVLGRPAEPAGLAFWNQALQNGSTYFDVALGIVNSSEAHIRVINDAYHQLLGRSAESFGQAFWSDQVNQGRSPDFVLAGLASSTEYINHYSGNGNVGATGTSGGAGTGPFYDEPFCADPFQFFNFVSGLGGGGGGSGSGGSGGSGGGSGGSGGSGGGSGGSGSG